MKKLLSTFVAACMLTFVIAGVAHASVFDPKRHAMCYSEDGKYTPTSKDCDPNSCGCLFHRIEEYIKGLF